MTPDQAIQEARADKLRPVYLLVGEETHLLGEAVTALKRAALAGGVPGLNEDVFEASEKDVDAVMAAVRTLPMMAKRRFVLVRGLERWDAKDNAETKPSSKTKEPFEKLIDYAKNPVSSTILVLVGAGVDKRRRLVNSARSDGWLVDCVALKREDLPLWIENAVRERGNTIGRHVADLIAELTGPELSPVSDAVERLCLYAGSGAEVTEDAVSECVVRLRPATVWELVGAVGRRDAGAALAALERVYDPADRGLRLVGVLAWSVRQLVKFEAATREGASPPEAAARAGAPPFKARELAQQVKMIPRSELERWLTSLAELDAALKGGSKRLPKSSLEFVILSMCGTKPRARSAGGSAAGA
jgi:DNA polymerase III subunit delta